MVVWKGWGLLVVLFLVICVFLVQKSVEAFYYVGYYQEQAWPQPLVFLLASIPTTFFGLKLNNKPARVLVDPETGEQVEIKRDHSLFWVPMQYWGIILCGFAALMYLKNIGVIYS